mmetsp:Transcript_48273/g.103076  ORF Transcript_48273/g.103076 Transcript_48273/m.103076 type:complete len:202 (-) Transcript_48273:416-1021(-)
MCHASHATPRVSKTACRLEAAQSARAMDSHGTLRRAPYAAQATALCAPFPASICGSPSPPCRCTRRLRCPGNSGYGSSYHCEKRSNTRACHSSLRCPTERVFLRSSQLVSLSLMTSYSEYVCDSIHVARSGMRVTSSLAASISSLCAYCVAKRTRLIDLSPRGFSSRSVAIMSRSCRKLAAPISLEGSYSSSVRQPQLSCG